jgi:hypothetical protein
LYLVVVAEFYLLRRQSAGGSQFKTILGKKKVHENTSQSVAGCSGPHLYFQLHREVYIGWWRCRPAQGIRQNLISKIPNVYNGGVNLFAVHYMMCEIITVISLCIINVG